MPVSASAFQRSAFVPADALEADPGSTCPLCDYRPTLPVLVLQNDPRVDLRRCPRCQGHSASKVPTDAFLDALYSGYYEPDQAVEITAASPARIARRIAGHARDAFRAAPVRDARILDIGGGDGSIATEVAARLAGLAARWDVTVVETGAERDLATGAAVGAIAQMDALPDAGSYGVIILSAVLEHMKRPMDVLAECMQRLGTPGLLYVRTPYVVPLMTTARRLGVRVDFTYPAHLHDMGAPFWDHVDEWWPALSPQDRVLASRPSPVESGVRDAPLRTGVSATLKGASRAVPPLRRFVGGWEWVVARAW